MPCFECKRDVPIENEDLGLCGSCNRAMRSDRLLYPLARQMFLEMCIRNDMTCPIKGTPITMESQIHHVAGRIGYASEEARQQGLSRLIDTTNFLAVSHEGHQWIELNPELAKKLGYSLPRLIL